MNRFEPWCDKALVFEPVSDAHIECMGRYGKESITAREWKAANIANDFIYRMVNQ